MKAPPSESTRRDADEAAVAASFARSQRVRIAEVVFWLLALAAVVALPRQALIGNEIAIAALFALSLDLILGYAGILSLGHAAFLGVGAYAAGLFARHVHPDPLLGLAVGAASAAALGLATSVLVLRGADLTRLMVTLGIALLLGEVANRAASITGGADGLQGIAMGPLFGRFAFDLQGRTAFAYSLAVTFLLFVLARRIVHSPFGASLRAIRDNRLRAAAIGVPVTRRLVAIYTIAATYAGIAGALLAQTTQFVSLDLLAFERSADVLLMLVIGGVGWLYGGLVGALVFKVAQDVFSGLTPQYWHFWIGLALVVLVLVRRDRLSALMRDVLAAVTGRGSARRVAASTAATPRQSP